MGTSSMLYIDVNKNYKDRLSDESIQCEWVEGCPPRDERNWFLSGDYTTPHCPYVGGARCDGICSLKEREKYGNHDIWRRNDK